LAVELSFVNTVMWLILNAGDRFSAILTARYAIAPTNRKRSPPRSEVFSDERRGETTKDRVFAVN
jgi:hypothetical protein